MDNLILYKDKNKTPINISVLNPTSEEIKCDLFAPKYSLPNNPSLKIEGANGVTYDFIQNEIAKSSAVETIPDEAVFSGVISVVFTFSKVPFALI